MVQNSNKTHVIKLYTSNEYNFNITDSGDSKITIFQNGRIPTLSLAFSTNTDL